MKYSILVILNAILQIFSIKQSTPPKICANCKHYKQAIVDDTYSKCALFKLQEYDVDYLVTGIKNDDFYYCSTARQSSEMCGKEGKFYKAKRTPKSKSPK